MAASSTTTATIIDGKKISEAVRAETAAEVARLHEVSGKLPCLAVILVGERKDSQTYVRMKKKAADELKITTADSLLPDTISEADLLEIVKKMNENPEIDGILVQLPLPSHISEEKILSAISIQKDVDGFHPMNIGQLGMKGREPYFAPCTPTGCIELLERSGVKITGKHAVVLGRSNIVGLPVALMLLKRNATVTICHSQTPNLEEVVRSADILIAAIGRARMVQKSWVKPGAVVIDVGINSVEDKKLKSGYRLVGDVDFDGVKDVASLITPVPGGVGPMTVALLMRNTVTAFRRRVEAAKK